MIDLEHDDISIRKQCTLLEIPRSTLYYKPKVLRGETELANEIHELWMEMPFYGYRRITAELQQRGHIINHKRVARMMSDMNIHALYPKQKISSSNVEHKKYPYLLRDLEINYPNHVWATDITYIKTSSGFVYLTGIIDVFSRFLVAWTLSNTMETDCCLETFEKALQTGNRPIILNSDQGAQFTSLAWIKKVEENAIKVSMDGIGRWADNIIIERFWRTIKQEFIQLWDFKNIKDMRKGIEQFINIYNYKRLHQSLGYKTPAAIYK